MHNEQSSEIKKIFVGIVKGETNLLERKIFSEIDLRSIARLIDKIKDQDRVVYNLIHDIPKRNKNYDWNVGSILQHLSVDLVIDFLNIIKNHYYIVLLVWLGF